MSDLKGIAPPPAIRAAAWFLCVWLASACGTQSAFDGGQMDPAVGSIQELLVREYDARVTGFPQTAAGVRALGDHQVLVFIASEPRTPILTEDCTRVAEEEFSYRQDAARNRAVGRGVVVRFHPGTMRIHYAPER